MRKISILLLLLSLSLATILINNPAQARPNDDYQIHLPLVIGGASGGSGEDGGSGPTATPIPTAVPTPLPTVTPTAIPTSAPTVTGPRAGAGVPLERDNTTADLPAVGASWYYNWAATSPMAAGLAERGVEFVPMSYAGEDPKLPADYSGYLLVFNEPDIAPQANLTPTKAADRYLALLAKYPKAKMVVGGVSSLIEWLGYYYCLDAKGQYIQSWTSCFLKEFERRGVPELKPTMWHAHAYLNEGTSAVGFVTPQFARETLEKLHAKTGGSYWITEYAEVHGDTAVFCEFTEWMKAQPWIARYAAFASRVAGSESWYPAELWGVVQKVSLVESDSSLTSPILTDMGAAYAACGK